jgi:prepilin-type N-terminal cleavage/methylation domain-containing protein
MANLKNRSRNDGFTLIELLAVIAIIALLCAFLFPVFASARERARLTQRSSNPRQINTAVHAYADDWEDCLPWDYDFNDPYVKDYFFHTLQPYLQKLNQGVWICPSDDPIEDSITAISHNQEDSRSYWGSVYTSYRVNPQMEAIPIMTRLPMWA